MRLPFVSTTSTVTVELVVLVMSPLVSLVNHHHVNTAPTLQAVYLVLVISPFSLVLVISPFSLVLVISPLSLVLVISSFSEDFRNHLHMRKQGHFSLLPHGLCTTSLM